MDVGFFKKGVCEGVASGDSAWIDTPRLTHSDSLAKKEAYQMSRPVTLFTGQWADLSFDQICQKAKSFGYDGVELACWGDHFEVDKALKDKNYCKGRWDILKSHGLRAFAISSHLVGQAVCDLIDERHKAILPPDVWGDGEPEGVRQRAAEKMKATAKAA